VVVTAAPAAIVLDTLAAPHDAGLDAAVGTDAVQALRGELRAAARRWAAGVAPGNAFEANSAGAALAALDGHRGPVVLVAPDVPALAQAHAEAVLADLGAGLEMIVGAGHDARPYLVALAGTDPELIELAGGPLDALFAAAARRELAMSMIRHERRLASAADALALALDPLSPPELVARLGNLRPR
jgi:hypothetical protein